MCARYFTECESGWSKRWQCSYCGDGDDDIDGGRGGGAEALLHCIMADDENVDIYIK